MGGEDLPAGVLGRQIPNEVLIGAAWVRPGLSWRIRPRSRTRQQLVGVREMLAAPRTREPPRRAR